MNAKRIVLITATVPLALVMLLVVVVAGSLSGAAAGTGGDGLSVSCGAPARPMTADGRAFDTEQVRNAQIVEAVAAGRALPARASVIALATAMRESSLRNLGYGDRDSLGLFQQRPSQGWGTAAEIMDPVHATGSFLDRLVRVPGWQTLPLTAAADAVQHSAFPDAYAEYEGAAQQLADAFGQACTLDGGPAVPGRTTLDPAGYPWPGDLDDCDNDGHGYCAAECVSFAAWAVRSDGLPHTSPDFLGNADEWHAPQSSRTPAVGDVAQWDPNVNGAGGVGHVAYVAAVRADGEVLLWEYNWGVRHQFHTRWVPPSEPSRYLRFQAP